MRRTPHPKRTLTQTLARLAAAAALAAAALAPAPAAAQPVQVSGPPDWAPFGWTRDGTLDGVGARLALELLKELGVEAEVRSVDPWSRVLKEAELGRVDVVAAAYKTPEREAYLDFLQPAYVMDENVVWVRKGKAFDFKVWDDLIPKSGVAPLGDSYGPAFDAFIESKLKVHRAKGNEQCFQMLKMDRADYYPFSLFGGQIHLKKEGLEAEFERLATPVSSEPAYMAVSKKTTHAGLKEKLEGVLAKAVESGRVAAILERAMTDAAQK